MPNFKGETVEQAIESGLKSLNISKSEAIISVLEEGKRGFLGIGKKAAEVSIDVVSFVKEEAVNEVVEEPDLKGPTEVKESSKEAHLETNEVIYESDLPDDEAIEKLAIYLTEITRELDAPALVKVKRHKQVVVFDLETDKKGLLIGKHGKILNALQYLVQVYIHRIAKNRIAIMVNIGDYRERREQILQRLARRTAKEVRQTGQPVFLEPMPAFERKQVHAILANESDISTHSEGHEPHRYLVVELA